MKIFEKDGKVNFVDDNNVLVGFDYSQDCCESFGWSLNRTFPTECAEGENGIEPDGFQFDREYCTTEVPGVDVEDGGAVVFRLLKGEEEIFLMLWNSHNGYYGHGFDMTCGDERLHDGCL